MLHLLFSSASFNYIEGHTVCSTRDIQYGSLMWWYPVAFHILMPLTKWFSAFRDSFRSQGQESASTRSSALRKDRWHLVEGNSLYRESLGRLLAVSEKLGDGVATSLCQSFTYICINTKCICVYIIFFHNGKRITNCSYFYKLNESNVRL